MRYTASVNGVNNMIVNYDDTLKLHLRVFDDLDEALIKSYIRAAGSYIEKYVGFPCNCTEIIVNTLAYGKSVEVPKTATEVTLVEKFTEGEGWETITLDSLTLEDYGVYKALYHEDICNGYQYRLTCDNEPCISDNMKQAAYLLVSEYYENRENTNKNVSIMKPHINLLLDLDRIII
ncbi:MAG: head-tail connector protein [Candidatus Pacearchaeota archaeon]